MKTFVEWAEDRAMRATQKAWEASIFAEECVKQYMQAKAKNPARNTLREYNEWLSAQAKEEETRE